MSFIRAARCSPATRSKRGVICALSDEQYDAFFDVLRRKAEEYAENARPLSRSRSARGVALPAASPAALLIVLPNGLVKLINALPFVCGDFRRQSLTEIWGNFERAWQDPRVAKFINDLAGDPVRRARCINGFISEHVAITMPSLGTG